MLGFTMSVGSSSVLMVELWGLLTGLSLAWNHGFHNLILECDSTLAIHLVTKGCNSHHPYSHMVEKILELLNQDWNVRVFHLVKEGNRIVDQLANLGHSKSIGLHVLDSPPSCCGAMLNEDACGVSFLHRFLVF